MGEFGLSAPPGIYVDDPVFGVLCEKFGDINAAFAAAKRIAKWQGTRIQVCHRQAGDDEWQETALVWPDGKIDLTAEGCGFA